MNAEGTAHLRRRIYDLKMMLISALPRAEFYPRFVWFSAFGSQVGKLERARDRVSGSRRPDIEGPDAVNFCAIRSPQAAAALVIAR